MVDPVTISALSLLYEVVKYWLPVLGAAFGLFKVINWVKTSFVDIKSNVVTLNQNTGLLREEIQSQTKDFKDAVASQTHAFVAEVKELRSDFRTFYVPAILSQNAFMSKSPARAKRSGIPVVKKKGKR